MYGEQQIDGYAEGAEPLVFHHKNGEYRKYEDQKTSDLATGKSLPKKGLFKALVSTRGNRLMLIAVAACVALVYIHSYFSSSDNENVVGKVHCSVSAMSFDGTVYASLEMSGKSEKNISPEKLDVKFFGVDSDGAVSAQKEESVLFEENGQKIHTTFSDYDIVIVKCEVSSDSGGTALISCPVKRK